MIIFGLVTVAFFLLFMVLIPAFTAKDILINLYMAMPTAIVLLQLLYDKYKTAEGENAEQIRPIFWKQLENFQKFRKPMKMAIMFAMMMLPLLIIRLLPT